MKKLILILLIFLIHQNYIQADRFYYTVVAKSGLSLRAEKKLNSERISVIEFGEKVRLKQLHKQDRISVEGIDGFWIEVSIDKFTGYMFSGFLYPGELYFINEDDKLEEILIIDEYQQEYEFVKNGVYDKLHFRFFDPHRKWYGVKILSKSTLFQKINLELEINYSIIQEMHDEKIKVETFDLLSVINLNPNTTEKYNFFIGTKSDLPSEIHSNIHSQDQTNTTGKFLYPYQEEEFFINSNYLLKPIIIIDSTNYKNYYLLEVIHKYNRSSSSIGRKDYFFNSYVEQHCNYQSPRIIWSGDLNKDELPELILFTSIMEDKCGEPWNSLFISEVKNGEIKYKKLKTGINISSFK